MNQALTAVDRGLASVLLALGAIEADRGRWADALGWLDQVEAADPNDHRAAGPRATALAHLGRAVEADDLLREALARAPADDPTARGPLLAQLASLLIQQGQVDAARPLLDEAEALWRRTVTFPAATRSDALARLAGLRARLGPTAPGEALA